MDESMIWNLHGARYDLSPFLDSHPGGKSILMATRGLRDATPLFESYHAFANREYIRGKLEQYRVTGPGMCPLYTYDGLYARIVQRAREHFGAISDGVSVTNKVKANKWWWFKVLSEVLLMVIMWIVTFFIPVDNTPQMRLLTGFLTGCIFISLGFNTMHDASHFAIGARNHWTNQLFLRAWTAWALWSGCLWMTHHVIRHHSFTGHPELDPDTMHARPFIRKSTESPRSKYIRLPRFVTKLWQMAIIASSVFAFLPGMYVGQILSYSLLWPSKGHLWKMPYPIKGAFDRTYWEQALALSSLLSHFLVSPSWHASAGYFVGCNVAYAICILPDHDTFEAAVENHKELRHEAIHQPLGDWGEIQVRHSSDFGIGFWGRAFGELAGGINFQILHHCLPGVSHVHFPELTKVVEESCIEFNVPFVRHPSLGSALWSVTKTFVLTMAPIQKSKHLDQESAPETSPANHIGVSKKRERSRGLDGVTGLLFGAWLTLCALVIAQHGRHLLVVPLSLAIGLAFHYFKGSFDAKMVDEKFRETRLRRYSNMLSTSRMLSAICATFLVLSQQIEWLSREGLTEIATMIVMGVIAAELFALVIGATFALCVSRVVADTVRLALFSALVLRRNQPIALTLLSVDHALSLYSLPILVVPRIALQTVAVSALAAPLITAPLAYGSTALLALTTLVS